MKYAVVASGGKQYKVAEGDVVSVEKLDAPKDASYTFPEVLLVVDGDKKTVGTPTVAGAKVVAKIIGNEKMAKVRVAKFKAKAKYRRVQGSRKVITKLQIEKIQA